MSSPAKKILVADEDKDNRFLFKMALRDYQASLIEASSADECMNKVHCRQPDLIVINYMLEEVTAYDIARELARDEKAKHIPIIIMTPEGFDLSSEDPGVDDFLTKPFTTQQLLDTAKNVLGKRMFKKKLKHEEPGRNKNSKNNKVKKGAFKQGAKILIADDKADIIKLLQLILGERYELDVARSGKELIEKGLSNSYNLIISDVIMPEASGWKSIKKIRESGCMTPVIFNSGLIKDKELYETLKPEGPSDFLLKPFKTELLLTKVEEMISR